MSTLTMEMMKEIIRPFLRDKEEEDRKLLESWEAKYGKDAIGVLSRATWANLWKDNEFVPNLPKFLVFSGVLETGQIILLKGSKPPPDLKFKFRS